jgi:hypothetical protein
MQFNPKSACNLDHPAVTFIAMNMAELRMPAQDRFRA